MDALKQTVALLQEALPEMQVGVLSDQEFFGPRLVVNLPENRVHLRDALGKHLTQAVRLSFRDDMDALNGVCTECRVPAGVLLTMVDKAIRNGRLKNLALAQLENGLKEVDKELSLVRRANQIRYASLTAG